jgi:hypothetical protein
LVILQTQRKGGEENGEHLNFLRDYESGFPEAATKAMGNL